MDYIVIVEDLDFVKQLHIPDNIENIRDYVEEWLFAEYGIRNKDYMIERK